MKNFSVKTADFDSLSISGESPIVQSDLGTAPNQIPLNKDLGSLAYMNAPEIEDLNVDALELREIDSEFQLFNEVGNAVDAVDVFVYDTRKDSDGGAWRSRTQHTSWYNEELNTATRGGRREFPAVAVIVAKADKVTIYDGDDPDLNMWMVFEVTSGNLIGGSVLTAIHALNGIIVTSSTGYTMETRFVSDNSLDWFINQLYEYKGNISERNDTKGFSQIKSYGIVNETCNDVAMTVLPNAPIDTDTGLPIPTIAVATDGGISVIRDDGSVVDITATASPNSWEVIFTKSNKLGFRVSDTASSGDYPHFIFCDIPLQDHSSTYWYGRTDLLNFEDFKWATYVDRDHEKIISPINSYQQDGTAIEGYNFGFDTGLSIVASESNISPRYRSHSIITSSYNTGWMPGDIKLATLSDTKIEKIGHKNLITNGTFSAGTDWSLGEDWSISGGLLTKVPGSNSSNTTQDIECIVGEEYVITFELISKTTGAVGVYTVSGGDLTGVQNYYNTHGVYSEKFTATSSNVTIAIRAGSTAGLSVDNVSVVPVGEGELITNGTFDSETTGWIYDDNGTSSQSISDGVLTLSHTTYTNSMLYQILDLIPGKKYVLTGQTGGTNFDLCNIRIGSSLGGNQFGAIVSSEATSGNLIDHAITFTPTQSTTYISLRINSSSPDLSCDFDNISVRLAEDDRSMNNNGLQIFGEIDKSPVAPGADLVAYSGFSADNYLFQPYNPDLDFGTGDFCLMGWFKGTSTNGTILDRANSGATLGRVTLTFSTYLEFKTIFNGSTITCASNKSISDNTWHYFSAVRRDGKLSMYIDGFLSSSEEDSNHDLSNPDAYLNVGLRYNLAGSLGGGDNLALLRASATAPTDEQIAKIYRDEKVLFQDGAQATLYGTSDAVTALAYDDSENLLHVGTASGRSVFNGLKRVDNTTTAVTTAISAKKGFVIAQ